MRLDIRDSVLEQRCATVIDRCLATATLPTRGELVPVREASEMLVRTGFPLRSAQSVVHAAVGCALRSDAMMRAEFIMSVLESIGSVVADVYLDHCRRGDEGSSKRAEQLVDMLIAGDRQARRAAEQGGFDLVALYDVIVLQFFDARGMSLRVGTEELTQVEYEVHAIDCSSTILMALSAHGATVLLPSGDNSTVDALVERVAKVVSASVSAATATAVTDEISGAAMHCRELLRLARCLNLAPRLYRMSDLALEYQLSRPGPGRSRLRSVLEPLQDAPELLHTLRTFIASEANRRSSAKTLFVHPNTVDYRLKRIEHLTGVDPMSSSGLMTLHAALVAESVVATPGPSAEVPSQVAEAS